MLLLEATDQRPFSSSKRPYFGPAARVTPRSYRPASVLLIEASVFQIYRSCYSSKQSFLGKTRRVPQCFRARPRTFHRDLLQVIVEEHWNPGNLSSRVIGITEYWNPGILISWVIGIPEYWYPGNLSSWVIGIPEYWDPGILISWVIGIPEYWYPGNLSSWVIGISEY